MSIETGQITQMVNSKTESWRKKRSILPPYTSIVALILQYQTMKTYHKRRAQLFERYGDPQRMAANLRRMSEMKKIIESLKTDGIYAHGFFCGLVDARRQNVQAVLDNLKNTRTPEAEKALADAVSDVIYYTHQATVVADGLHITKKPEESQHNFLTQFSELEKKARDVNLRRMLSEKQHLWIHSVLVFHGITKYENLRWKEK